THDRVVVQEVGEGLVVGEVVDADDLDVRPRAEHGPEKAAADATEAVDSDADGHYVLLQCAGRRTQCRVFVERHEARRRRPPRWWGPSARTNLHLDKWDRSDEGPRTRPGMTDVTARSRPFSQVEHLRGEDGLGVGDAQGVRPLVRHGQETPDAPGDGVL